MKIDEFVAGIIALGRGANGSASVSWNGSEVYCLSFDKTVLIHASDITPKRKSEVNFKSGDFESPVCLQREDKIIFEVKVGGSDMMQVTVAAAEYTFDGLKKLFDGLAKGMSNKISGGKCPAVVVSRDIVSALDESVPHVEFIFKSGICEIYQRDIYSGRVVHIKKISSGKVEADQPAAIRTADFISLFRFSNDIALCPVSGNPAEVIYCIGISGRFEAVIGGCLFDGLGKLNIVEV